MSFKGLRVASDISNRLTLSLKRDYSHFNLKSIQRSLHSSVLSKRYLRMNKRQSSLSLETKLPEVILRNHLHDYPNYRGMASTSESGPGPQMLPHVDAKEIQFPVSWGHIACKEWGVSTGLHGVLCVHGWLDNSGSFDPIVPYLLKTHKKLHIVAMDEPGCGLSSHKPPGSEYGRWSTLKEMKRVIDNMQWKDVTLLGHSLGANYSLLFAAIYPDLVRRVISIDVAKPLTFVSESWVHRVPKAIDMHLRYDEKFMKDPTLDSSAPIYSEPDALKKMTEAHGHSLIVESAKILMKRGTKRLKWGVTFSRDIRHNLPPFDPSPSEEAMINFMSRIRCDLLIIRAKQGPYHVSDKLRQQYYDLYERNCRMFRDVLMDGSHHLHMNNPDKVGAVVNDFIAESIDAGPLFNRHDGNFKSNL